MNPTPWCWFLRSFKVWSPWRRWDDFWFQVFVLLELTTDPHYTHTDVRSLMEARTHVCKVVMLMLDTDIDSSPEMKPKDLDSPLVAVCSKRHKSRPLRVSGWAKLKTQSTHLILLRDGYCHFSYLGTVPKRDGRRRNGHILSPQLCILNPQKLLFCTHRSPASSWVGPRWCVIVQLEEAKPYIHDIYNIYISPIWMSPPKKKRRFPKGLTQVTVDN